MPYCALLQPRGDFGSPALIQARKEIAILRSCRDVNILRFVVRKHGTVLALLQ